MPLALLQGRDANLAAGPVIDLEFSLKAGRAQAGDQRVINDPLAANAVKMQEPWLARFRIFTGLHGQRIEE
jgi:hypothetical protein